MSGSAHVGGLVGLQFSDSSITNAFATGAVRGYSLVGGLVGYEGGDSSITNAYATGAVNGTDFVGGLVGDLVNDSSITNAYATGAVSLAASQEGSFVGGLVGSQFGGGSISNGYYDTLTTGQTSDGAGATGLTTSQLQSGGASLGSAFAGGANGLYPYLTFQFPNGSPQAVSGFVFAANGTTGLSGASVAAYANGGALTDALTGAGASTGANGYYYYLLAPGTLSGGKLGASFAPAGSTAVAGLTYTDQATGSTPSLTLTTGLIALTTAEATQSALIGDVNATFGSATYAGLSSALSTASLNEASLSNGFTIDQAITAGGSVTLTTPGALTLSANVAAGSGANVTLATNGAFNNTAGANAISVSNGGVWDIYSANPMGDTFGGLNSNNTAVWGTAPGAAISQTGDRYIFANSPTLTVSVGNLSKTYGQDATASVAADFTISGLQAGVTGAYLGDTASSVYSGAPTVTSTGAAAKANSSVVNGGDYAITASATGLTVGDGYTLAIAPSSATLHVNQLAETVSGTQVYNGTTIVQGSVLSLASTVNGDQVTVGGTATMAGKDVVAGGSEALATFSGLTLSNNNYTISGGSVSVTPEAITVTAATGSKTYDGTTASSLTPTVTSGTLYTGDATLSQTYNSKDVNTATTLTPTETFASSAVAGDYTVTNVTAAGTITPYTLTAGLTGTVSKTYNASTAATLTGSNYTLTSAIGGDTVALNGPTTGIYSTANAGPKLGVSVSGLTLANNSAGDYQLASTSLSANIGTITPEAITVTAATGSKTYDGTTASSLTPTVTSGTLYTGDATLSQTYNSKDVNTATTLTPTETFASSAVAGDYTVTNVTAAGTITPYTLTAGLTGTVSKTYNASTAATLTGSNYTLTSAIGGDTVALNGPTTGIYSTANAGPKLGVSVSGLTLANNSAGDYQLASTSLSANIGTITPEAVTVTAVGGSKVYNASTASTLTPTVTSGKLYAGDAALSESYNSQDVATATTLTPVETFANATVAGDYTVSNVTAHGTITPAPVTATLTGTVSKVYNGNVVATVPAGDVSLSGVLAGDAVSVTTPTVGQYASANVGTAILVGATGFNLAGAQAGDYALTSAFAFGNVGTITPEAVTVTAVGGSRVYNGSTASSLTPTVTSGTLYAGDASLSESYNSQDVATATTLTPVETFANATVASDYTVRNVTANGTITPAPVTATLTGTVSKVYNGNVVATVPAGDVSLSGILAGDAVSVTTPTAGQYASANVGTAIQVGATGFNLTGAQAGDYALTSAFAFGNVGTITPAPLTATLTGTASKVYNGNASATLTPSNYVLSGFVSGQGASVTQTAGTYANDNAGNGISVTALLSSSSLTPTSGTLLSNYTLPTSATGNIGTITPASLSVSLTGLVSKVYDGTTTATLTPGDYRLSGVIGNDQVSVATSTGTYVTKNVASAIPVTVSGLTLTGSQSQDYILNVTSLTAPIGTITPYIIQTTPSTYLSGLTEYSELSLSAPGDYGLIETIGSTTIPLITPPVLAYNPLLTPLE